VQSARFRPLLDTPGPFASVYFEDSHSWRGVREQLEEQGVDDSVTADIEKTVLRRRAPAGCGGRAVVAGANGVVLDERLLRPIIAPVVRVSELPYLVPIVERGFEQPNYLLAVVDHAGADITAHVNGSRCSEAIDDFSEDDFSEFAAVFVVGQMRSRSDLVAALPDRVGERAIPLQVGAGNSGHGGRGDHNVEEIHRAIDATFRRRQLRVIDHAAARFDAEVGRKSGRAAEGLAAVCSALRQGAVETLIVGKIRDATVVTDQGLTTLAPNAEVLSEQGAAPAKTLRADEVLPLFAISAGAALVCTDERIAPADGVAAVLR
jgi:peptide chain release factor subunit 1